MTVIQSAVIAAVAAIPRGAVATTDSDPAYPDYSNNNNNNDGLNANHYNLLNRFIRSSSDIYAKYDKLAASNEYQINSDIGHDHSHDDGSGEHGHNHHHEHHHEYENVNCTAALSMDAKNLLFAKVTAMLVLFTASMICGLIPFKLSQWLKWSETMHQHGGGKRNFTGNIISMLLALGGGVLLCTTFLHMLPEVIENIQLLQENNQMPSFMGIESIHYGELLMCMGFFTMYLVEEVVHFFIHRYKRMYGETEVESAFERGMSIRNSALMRGKICRCDSSIKRKDGNCCKLKENVARGGGRGVLSKSHFSNKKKESISVTELISSTNGNDIESGSISSINDLGIIDSSQHSHYRSNGGSFDENYDNDRTNMDDNHLHNTNHHNHHEKSNANGYYRSHNNNHHNHHHDHNGGGHSHLPINMKNDDDDVIVSSLRGLLIVLALSVHELFEGFAVGLELSTVNVWYMFGAVATHKLVIAFCVGVELIVNKTKNLLAVLYIFTFAVVSPLGIGIGAIISMASTCSPDGRQLSHEPLVILDELSSFELNNESATIAIATATTPNLAAVILQGLATGTLLYVVFFEILIKTRVANESNGSAINRIQQYVAVLLGFIIMFGLQLLCTY